MGFASFSGIGPMRCAKLVEHYGDVYRAYRAPLQELKTLLPNDICDRFSVHRKNFDAKKEYERLTQLRIKVITVEDPLYPVPLRNISDPPICLFVRGKYDVFDFEHERCIGVVGTRKPSQYGIQVTQIFSEELAQNGMVIVSGLAYGIDAQAHISALNVKGKTIAFLGCGVDIKYPSGNASLYDRIVAEGGLVISEFYPGQTVVRGLFVSRNRLISGISQGVIVIEGTAKSGTLITAREACEQGKDVFVPPVPITSSLSEGPNLLLKQGAQLVTSPQDILDEYGLTRCNSLSDNNIVLSEKERVVYNLLRIQGMSVDELVFQSKSSFVELVPILTSLELQSVIKKKENGLYTIL